MCTIAYVLVLFLFAAEYAVVFLARFFAPNLLRKLVDFISTLFPSGKDFVFCDQVPFLISFKRHCTALAF